MKSQVTGIDVVTIVNDELVRREFLRIMQQLASDRLRQCFRHRYDVKLIGGLFVRFRQLSSQSCMRTMPIKVVLEILKRLVALVRKAWSNIHAVSSRSAFRTNGCDSAQHQVLFDLGDFENAEGACHGRASKTGN